MIIFEIVSSFEIICMELKKKEGEAKLRNKDIKR